jgi:pyroglutamyl-peptidase
MKKTRRGNTQPMVLLTGFEAFGGDCINPSWLAAQALDGEILENHRVLAAQLPCDFAASSKALSALLRQHQPVLVLCMGLAGGRAKLSLERVAINVQDARIADNAGAQPIDLPIAANGPVGYFSTLPIKAMLQALTAAGIPAEVSQTAGTFVCNHVFYALMQALKKQRRNVKARGGFAHLPYLPDQGLPCMPLDQMLHGLRVAIACALTTQTDVLVSAGAVN